MIKNYWTIFIRSFKRYRLSNILSILSVSISMGVGIMLLSNINGHFQADTFHPNIENTYRVITRVSDKNSERHYATTPEFIADSLTKHSSIRNICIFSQAGVRDVEAKFGKVDLQIAQTTPTFFEMFGFKVTPESAASSINGGTSVLLTNEASEKIFGKEQALGKVVQIDQFGQFIVGGVIRKPRLASHLKFDALISLPIRTTASDSLSQKNDI